MGFGIAADLDGENAGHDDHHSQPVLEGQGFCKNQGRNQHPEAGIEKMKCRGTDRTDTLNQVKPDQGRQQPRCQKGVEKRSDEAKAPVKVPGFKNQGEGEKHEAADQHLQSDQHHHILVGTHHPADPKRGACEGHGPDHTKSHSQHGAFTSLPLGHDEDHSAESCNQSQQSHHLCFLTKEQPAEDGHDQRQGAGNDRRQTGFDPLHAYEIQTEVEGVLTDSDDHHPEPFFPFQFNFLPHHPGQGDAQQAGDEKTDRKDHQRGGGRHQNPGRGEGTGPDHGKANPHQDGTDVHRQNLEKCGKRSGSETECAYPGDEPRIRFGIRRNPS